MPLGLRKIVTCSIALMLLAGAVLAFTSSDALCAISGYSSGITLSKKSMSVVDSVLKQTGDTLGIKRVVVDSVGVVNTDTVALNDSLVVSDSVAVLDTTNHASIDYPVFSVARDSCIEELVEGKRMIYFYGDISVKYNDLEIKSEYMAYDMQNKTVFAKGLPDTTGKIIGSPVMKQGNSEFEMESVYYNFESKKAKIRNMKTQQDEGIIHGSYIKKMPDNSINIAQGKYTTCDEDHPHFYAKLSAAKVISQGREKKVVFGPAMLYVEDVPTPVVLPFGFVPSMSNRSGGLLMPSFGEETARGFFLRGLGYYFVLSDHFDVAATVDIYTKGSWGAQLNSRYNTRYKSSGTFALNYSKDVTGEKGMDDYFESKNFAVQWTHSMDAKRRPGTTFRASVNFSSPSNSRYNSTNLNQALTNQISSSISYGKTWTGTPFALTVNATHSQNSRDSSYAVTFPNFTFTLNRINPFKQKERVGKEKWYESFTFNYQLSADNKVNFKSSEFGEPEFFNKMKNGMQHSFGIGLPTFSLMKYVTVAPSVSYGMNMYFSEIEKKFNQHTQQVESIQSDPFSTFGLSQTFSAALQMSTRIYGTFMFGKKRKVEAIRHMITPSLSFGYQPEMGTSANGYTSMSYVDRNGIQHVVDYNRYEGQIYSPAGRGENASMSLSFGNNVEAKVRDRKDSTGTGVKKIKLIDQLSIGGSYNFLADSFKLSTISVNMTTSVFGKMVINANCSLDPYDVNEYGTRVNKFVISNKGGFNLARLTNASFSTSYQFQGDGKGRMGSNAKPQGGDAGIGSGDEMSSGRAEGGGRGHGHGSGGDSHSEMSSYYRTYYHPITGEYIPGGWVYYLDPNIPWSLNLNLNYSYSRSYQYANERLNVNHNHMLTLGAGAQIRLSPRLNISMNTGWDFKQMALSTSQLSGTFDLHCFTISFSWIPNGQWQSWSFRINAKASALADLLQFKKNNSYWDK